MIVHELNKKSEITFPEGKIVTLDDRTLDCYPIANENVNVIGHEADEQKEMFVNNAFCLLAHRERIMSDSRMFLCPVCGHALTGSESKGNGGGSTSTMPWNDKRLTALREYAQTA